MENKINKNKIVFCKWMDDNGKFLPVNAENKTPMDFEAIELVIPSHVLVDGDEDKEFPEFAPYDLLMAWDPSLSACGRKGGSIFLGYYNQ